MEQDEGESGVLTVKSYVLTFQHNQLELESHFLYLAPISRCRDPPEELWHHCSR